MNYPQPRKTRAKRSYFCCIFIGVLLAAAFAGLAAEPDKEGESRGLFFDVPAPKLNVAVRPTGSRRRVVTLDVAALRGKKMAGASLRFNLFPEAEYEGVVEQIIERGEDEFTLRGRLEGHALSSFALSVKEDVAVMNIRTADRGMFHLRYLGNGFYHVRQIDENKYPPCGTTAKHAVAPPPGAAPARTKANDDPPEADNGATIDVMVVYTPAARAAAGGTAAVQALIDLAVDESNTAYQRSLIAPRLRLVHQEEVTYTESATFDTDLSRLTSPSDGYLDQVHTLRNTYGADLVCMLIDNTEFCGLAWLMTSLSSGFASSAFSVVYWDCATGYYSLAHELGHNMGCAHDAQNAAGPGLYSYSYGWRFVTAGNVTNRTIMAYAPGTRIQNFSNPNVLYNGVATGVPVGQANEANNALTINNSAFTVANFRQAVVQCGFALSPTATNFSSAVSPCTVNVTASNACAWTAASQSSFITVTAGTNGSGNGTVSLSVATNGSSAARTGTVTIAGLTFTVAQARTPCSYALALMTTNFPAPAGNGTVSILSQSGCAWTAASQSPFITVTSGPNGSGNGTVSYAVEQNDNATSRSGTILIAGQVFTVVQAASPQIISLPIALETPGATWTNGGDGDWAGQNTTTHDGVDAARCSTVGHNQQSWMETSVDGPGTLAFWWKVSSEAAYDHLHFIVDGVTNQSISGEVDWQFHTVVLGSGSHAVRWAYAKDGSRSVGQDAAWVDQVQLPLRDFMIASLSTNATIIDHELITGDDRGGMAASSSSVFYTGDGASGGFDLGDLSGGINLGQRYDGLVSDLRTETMYLLANSNTPVVGTTFNGSVDRLLEMTPLGVPNGNFIALSQVIPLSGTNGLIGGAQAGIFAGYGHIVIHNRTNVFSIALPSGAVNDLGVMGEPAHARTENWAYWGVAEYFSNALHLVYVRDQNAIVRTRVSDGTSTTLAGFANLSDMAAFTVSVPRERWYFHHEYGSQFGGSAETLGFAPAQFAFVPAAVLQATIARLDGSTVQLVFRGPPARGVILEQSEDLISWSAVATNLLSPAGAWTYSNSTLGTPNRFYRAVLP